MEVCYTTYFNGVAVTGDVLMVHHHHWYKQLQQITWKQQQAKILLQVFYTLYHTPSLESQLKHKTIE
jgi:hypothetical protein